MFTEDILKNQVREKEMQISMLLVRKFPKTVSRIINIHRIFHLNRNEADDALLLNNLVHNTLKDIL